jgi:hypothetical protein
MSARARKLLIGGVITISLVCSAGGLLAALPLLSLDDQRARQLWEQRRPPHYEVDVTWASGWSFGRARVELRDGKFVRGVNLDNGRPLESSELIEASYFASIDNLFKILDQRLQPSWYWRVQLARHYPRLARRFDPCVAPLSDVSYDTEFGYPTDISYNDGWCANTFFTYSNVKIIRFKPLP